MRANMSHPLNRGLTMWAFQTSDHADMIDIGPSTQGLSFSGNRPTHTFEGLAPNGYPVWRWQPGSWKVNQNHYDFQTQVNSGKPFTMAGWIYQHRTFGDDFIFMGNDGDGQARYVIATGTSNTKAEFRYTTTTRSGTNVDKGDFLPASEIGFFYFVAGRNSSGNIWNKFYGVDVGSGSSLNTGVTDTSAGGNNNSDRIGGYQGVESECGGTSLRFYPDRLLSEEEADQLFLASCAGYPGMIHGNMQPIGLSSGGATAYTLTADASSYTLTGQSVALLRGLVLQSDAGAYILTGQDVTLTRGRIFGVDTGSYSHTGQDLDLLKSSRINSEAGAYSVTGQDVQLLKAYRISTDAASYTLTGQQVDILRNIVTQAEAGAFTFTGQDVTLDYSATTNFTLDAEAGSYTLTGQAVDILRQVVLDADAGSYTVTGQAVGLTIGVLLAISPGSFNLSGQDVTFLTQRQLEVLAGSYAVSGRNVTLTYSGAETHEFIIISDPKIAIPKINSPKIAIPTLANARMDVQS